MNYADPLKEMIRHALIALAALLAQATAWLLPSHAHSAQFSLLGRYSQGSISYQGDDVDLGFASSADAIVDLASAELRVEPSGASRAFYLTGSLQLEGLRQVVAGQQAYSSRAQLRLSLVKNGFVSRAMRQTTILHAGAGFYNFYRPLSPLVIDHEKVMRSSIGAGLEMAYLYQKNLELAFWAILRVDLGASSAIAPNPLERALGSEAGLGVKWWFSKSHFIEIRGRSTSEPYTWAPEAGGETKSSMTNQLLLLDIGLGYRF